MCVGGGGVFSYLGLGGILSSSLIGLRVLKELTTAREDHAGWLPMGTTWQKPQERRLSAVMKPLKNYGQSRKL